MRWLIDSDILIEGERGNPGFVRWLESVEEVATADVVRCEFLMGVHAVPEGVFSGPVFQYFSFQHFSFG